MAVIVPMPMFKRKGKIQIMKYRLQILRSRLHKFRNSKPALQTASFAPAFIINRPIKMMLRKAAHIITNGVRLAAVFAVTIQTQIVIIYQ
ncbi:hypothetical protein CFII64_15567 [Pseudomonas sp. CFII64]|nr:hypothetical protein CFII64_15567 [Pseudomonas sp. CFII64]